MPVLLAALAQAMDSVPSEKIDVTEPVPCEAEKSSESEIVVCAKRPDGPSPYRIKQLPPRKSSGVPNAEMQLADGLGAGAHLESHDVGGFPSNRIMVRLKIKF